MHAEPVAPSPSRRARRLRPEVAAALAARRISGEVEQLYQRPVDDLSPEEIARMKAAFFRG